MDLFDHSELIPDVISDIIESYNEDADLYAENERMLKEMNKHGYTFEYGLDGVPYDLRKMSENDCDDCGYDMGEGYVNCGASEDGVCPECGTEKI